MTDTFKIFIDRLLDGREQDLDDTLSNTLLFSDETDIKFSDATIIQGKAYLAADHLVIDIYAKTEIQTPCIICNDFVSVNLEMERQNLTIPLEEISQKIYNFKDLIRESLLLQLPLTIECKNNCPERVSIEPYLVKEQKDSSKHFPFLGLD